MDPLSAERSASKASMRAVWRLLAGAVLISFAPVFVNLVEVAPTASAFYRTLIGGLVLLTWVVLRRRWRWPSRWVALAIAGAGLAFAADLSVWHRSILYIGPGLATLLGNFQVFALAFIGVVFFNERLRPRLVISTLVAVVGLGLIVGTDWRGLDARSRAGIGFGLLTAVMYAAYVLCLRAAGRASPTPAPARDLAVASLLSALFLLALVGAEGASLAIPSARDASLLVGYALVAQVFGWLLISSALEYVPASRVGLLLLLQPSLAFVWDIAFFARSFGGREAVGAALALGAIYIGTTRR